MLPNCFTCPYKVVQYNEHLHNSQNQETELFSGTKILPDLEALRGTEGVVTRHSTNLWRFWVYPPYYVRLEVMGAARTEGDNLLFPRPVPHWVPSRDSHQPKTSASFFIVSNVRPSVFTTQLLDSQTYRRTLQTTAGRRTGCQRPSVSLPDPWSSTRVLSTRHWPGLDDESVVEQHCLRSKHSVSLHAIPQRFPIGCARKGSHGILEAKISHFTASTRRSGLRRAGLCFLHCLAAFKDVVNWVCLRLSSIGVCLL